MPPASRRKRTKRNKNPRPIAPYSNLHEPFLRRAADATDGPTSSTALGGFLTLRLVDVFDSRFGRLSPEALAYQIQATSDYLTDLHPVTTEVKHLQEIVRVSRAAFEARDPRLLWPPMLAYAYWLEQELLLEAALDVLDTALELSDGRDAEEEVTAHLQRGRVLRVGGRFDEAREAYAAGGEMAARLGDKHSVLLSRIGRGIVTQMRGNLPEAEQVFRDVLREAEANADQDVQARACHDLAGTLYQMGRNAEGIPLAFRAFQLYEDEGSKLRALSDLGQLLKNFRAYKAAEDAFLLVVASGDAPPAVVANATCELIEIASVRQDRIGFERWRKAVEARGNALPPETLVDYALKVGEGLARFGELASARKQLRAALELAQPHGLNRMLFQAEAALARLDRGERQHAVEASAADRDPEVAVVASRLHQLRAAS